MELDPGSVAGAQAAGWDPMARARSGQPRCGMRSRPARHYDLAGMEEKLAAIKPGVYRDPRPKEHFDPFHARTRSREPDYVYELVRIATSLTAWAFFRARGSGAERVPAHGPLILAPNHF
jgi:hypothetical protein